MLKDIDPKSVVQMLELFRNKDFQTVFSAEFQKKNRDEQEAIIGRIRPFVEENINPDKIIYTSRDYYYPTVDFLVEQLKKHMGERIISKQTPDGGWLLVDWNYLRSFDDSSETEKKLEKYFNKYKDTYNKIYNEKVEDAKEILVPTYWSNYLVLLLLNKWKLCIKNNNLFENGYSLEEIDATINLGARWLKENSLGKGNGWSRGHKDVSVNLNTYDTCMALIAINYHMSFFKQDNIDEEFFGMEHLEKLISDDVRNKNGSWKKEINSDSEDTGATSYALQCLMKYYRRGDDNSFKQTITPIITDGIAWLIQNQLNSDESNGGWGESNKLTSNQSSIERTCYALMALSKYRKVFTRNQELPNLKNLELSIRRGLDYLVRQKRMYDEYPVGLVWPDDFGNGNRKSSLRNTSLVMSTFVRCSPLADNFVMKQGIIGASRSYEKDYDVSSPPKKTWYNPIYFFCMLADYLKLSM